MAERQIAHDQAGREYWWKNGQWEPINEVSPAESIAIGAGESMVNLARGVEQGINKVGEFFGDEASARSNERLDRLQQGDQQIMAGLREENPVSTFVGNVLPAVAAAPLGGSTALGQSLIGGAGGLLSHGSLEERLQRGAIGFGASSILPMSVRVSQSITGSANSISGAGIRNIPSRMMNRIIKQETPIGAEVQAQRAAGIPDTPRATGDAFDQLSDGIEREVFAADSVGAARPFGTTVGEAAARNSQERQLLAGLNRDAQGLTPGQQSAIDVLRKEGITLEPGMSTGNRGQRLLSSSMKSHPITANMFESLITAPNRQVLTRKIGAALGEVDDLGRGTLDEFTPSTMVNIEEKFSNVRSDIMERVPEVDIGDAGAKVKAINNEYKTGIRGAGELDPVQIRMNKLEKQLDADKMPTEQYQRLREDMRELQRSATSANDRTAAATYGDLVEVIDDMFAKNVTGADLKAWKETTQGFRLLTALERGAAIGNDGTVRLGSLSNNLKRVFKREFAKNNRFKGKEIEGTSKEMRELFDLVKALGKNQDLVGDSGTATRSALSSIVGDKTTALGLVASRPLMRQWIKRSQ